jgi:S1-C subfamily serine protease
MPASGGSAIGGGESIGTFFSGIASRIAIGPALSVAEETAANTARTAAGVEELVAAGRVVPNAGALRAGIASGGPVAAAGVAAASDRDLISAAERTAMSSERMLEELKRLGATPGVTFL